MGKKKKAELDKQKERFISGAIKKGIGKDVANFVFTKIEPFAQYGFNKSHAAAYALIAFQTAYLKTYYKEEFIASTMSTETTNTNKLREFVDELKRLKVNVVRPDINQCFADFRTSEKTILYGLGAIKNVGSEAVSNLVKERESKGKFKSLNDFVSSNFKGHYSIVELNDNWGPGVFEESLNAIIVSEETEKVATELNVNRRLKGLKELEIVVIPLVLAKDGRRISSTRIRNKEINIEGSKA